MKANKSFLLIFFLTINLFASSLVVTSDVTTNTTWDVDTVFIDKSPFTVQKGARLTIMPGTVVKVMKSLRFITVRGTITAIGTETDSINFAHEISNVKWQGIRILRRDQGTGVFDSSFIKYCNLVRAYCVDVDSIYMKKGAALYCGPGNYVELSNCLLTKNEGYNGGAVYVDSGATVRINNCHFLNNTAGSMGGGAITTCPNGGIADLLVQNCLFEYNHARTGGALLIGKEVKASFNNCVFYRDTTHSINPQYEDLKGGAIAINGPADVTLRGCIIYKCKSYDKGGGIYSSDASIKLINCTIVKNLSIYGGGIYFARGSEASSPLLINTIEGGNGKITGVKLPRDSAGCGIFLDSAVTPVFRHCQLYDTVYDYAIMPYKGEFVNSRYEMTDFVHIMERDFPDTLVMGYQLDFMDSAIDDGTPDTTGLGLPEFDLLGQKRIYGAAVDIGAIEYNDSIFTVATIPRLRKLPQFRGEVSGAVIYSLSGRKLMEFKGTVSSQSIQQFVSKKYARGIYLVSMKYRNRDVGTRTLYVK